MEEICEQCGNDRWPKPSLAVDAVVTRLHRNETEALLIRRGNEPWKGAWAFPGGFVELDENPTDAVLRELMEETGIKGYNPQVLTVRGNPNRDPRKHIVSILFYCFCEIINRTFKVFKFSFCNPPFFIRIPILLI